MMPFEFLHGVYLTHKVGEGGLQNIWPSDLRPFSSLSFSSADLFSVQAWRSIGTCDKKTPVIVMYLTQCILSVSIASTLTPAVYMVTDTLLCFEQKKVQNKFGSEKIYVFHEHSLSSDSNSTNHLQMRLSPDYR